MHIARWSAGGLVFVGLCYGADPPIEKLDVKPRVVGKHEWVLPTGTPAEQVKQIADKQKQLQEEFFSKYKVAKTDADRRRLFEAEFPEPNAPAKLMLEIAAKHPKDPAAFDALFWAARNSPRPPNEPDTPFAKARDALMKDFSRHPRIGEFCRMLAYEVHHLPSVAFVREVYEKHPDATARAQAGLTLAHQLRQQAVKKEAEAILDRLVADKELANVTYERGDKKRTVGEAADAELFEIRHLQPGKPAPDIEGEDIDGKRFKLSDYRGNVILLDFWGHW